MALEVWSEMQFQQKIYTKDAEVDGKIKILPITKTNFPEFQGVEIYGGGIEIGSVYDYFYPNYKSGELSIGIIDSKGASREKVISYSSSDCPKEVGLDSGGTFLANGFELYNRSTNTISKIYSPEDNLLNFDHVTTLMYAKNTPTRELSGSKEQFCIQLDSSNGAVTLRNVPNGTNETIFGGYVTLYRPTGMGSSETRFDTLYLDEYKNGNRSIGTALDDIESRLNDEGFKSGSFGTDDDHPSIFLDEHGNSINALKGSIHQSGALVEVIIDTANSDIQAFVDQYSNNYTCRLADKVKDWGGNWFTLKKPSAIRTDIQSSWTESYTIYINTPYNQPQFWVVTIKYPNQTNDTPTVTFTQGTTAIDRVTYNNTSFCWRTKY